MASATERLFRFLMNPQPGTAPSTVATDLSAAGKTGGSDILKSLGSAPPDMERLTLNEPGGGGPGGIPGPADLGRIIAEGDPLGGGADTSGDFGELPGQGGGGGIQVGGDDSLADDPHQGQGGIDLGPGPVGQPGGVTTSGTSTTGTGGKFTTEDWLQVIGLTGQALGAYLDYRSQQSQFEALEDEREWIRAQAAAISSPDNFLAVFQALLPTTRSVVGATQGATIQNAVANQIARVGGLQDTGLGAALNSLAPAANEATAIAQAFLQAENTINNQLAGLGITVDRLASLPIQVPNFSEEIDDLFGTVVQLFGDKNQTTTGTDQDITG